MYKLSWKNTILEPINDGSDMYFIHSYIVVPDNPDHILSTTVYSKYEFCSSINKENIFGCQFHPEKSGEHGLKIIEKFTQLCKEKSHDK